MSSFVEGKVMNLVETYGPDFIKYNCRQISRTYPAGGRIDSSNYNPQHAWNVGCQIGKFLMLSISNKIIKNKV